MKIKNDLPDINEVHRKNPRTFLTNVGYNVIKITIVDEIIWILYSILFLERHRIKITKNPEIQKNKEIKNEYKEIKNERHQLLKTSNIKISNMKDIKY